MGTTVKIAGSQENFTKIDKEYVEAFIDHLDKLRLFLPFLLFCFLLPSR
jgi:hypothetical protein